MFNTTNLPTVGWLRGVGDEIVLEVVMLGVVTVLEGVVGVVEVVATVVSTLFLASSLIPLLKMKNLKN